MRLYVKASLTIEATIIVSLFILIMGITMNMAIILHKEIKNEHEEKKNEEIWLVDDFYKYQNIEEVINDQ